jgi:hypothetical protein
MSEYVPDRWVVLKINSPSRSSPLYKVFAGWSGGYLDGDSWKLNSGITKVEEDGDYLLFHGHSGSVYKCHKKGYGMTSYMSMVFQAFELFSSIIDENTDFLSVDYLTENSNRDKIQ